MCPLFHLLYHQRQACTYNAHFEALNNNSWVCARVGCFLRGLHFFDMVLCVIVILKAVFVYMTLLPEGNMHLSFTRSIVRWGCCFHKGANRGRRLLHEQQHGM